jgi:hypothetical protein
MKIDHSVAVAVASFTILLGAAFATRARIYDFKGGVRIPAGSCATYPLSAKPDIVTSAGGLSVFGSSSFQLQCVCSLPVPEKAQVRQFVMVGNVVKGTIQASLGGVRWNVPRQITAYASLTMGPTTPYEVPDQKQKKVVVNLPVTGAGSLLTDRIQTYVIETRFVGPAAVSLEEALEIFYFEVYWD